MRYTYIILCTTEYEKTKRAVDLTENFGKQFIKERGA